MPTENETRPFTNEHSCRLRDPGDFKDGSFRRMDRDHKGKKYSVIMGKLKGDDSMTEQAYRYKKSTWTADAARSHCKSNDGSFEAAKDSKSDVPDDVERRILPPADIELRVEDEKNPRLVGYAAKYGRFTELGWFRERIQTGAFDDALKEADVRCLKNHDPNLILGRTTSGTLRLESNTIGLRFEDEVPDTNTGRDTLEEVRRGDISGCSFAFTVAEQNWRYFEDEPEKLPERTIVKIAHLYDVGPVTYPAYPDTTVAARSLEEAKREKETEEIRLTAQAHAEDELKTSGQETGVEQKEQYITQAEQCEAERRYRKAKRIIAHNKSAKS